MSISANSLNVVHFITRMIVGGAQQNTLWTVLDQHRDYGDRVTLISGVDDGPEGSLLDQARDAGIDVRVIPELRRSINPLNDWKSYHRLLWLLRELKPDLVHTHSSKGGVIGRAAARKLRIPAVHTIHGAAFHYGQSAVLRSLYIRAERWAAKRTDHFITVCDAMTEQYLAQGIGSPDRYTTIYSGMEVEPFLQPARSRDEVRAELGIRPDEIVIGKIARLFPLKGHQHAIEAARRLIPDHPNLKFLFVGDGILREAYQRTIDEAGLAEHFIFTGLVPPERIPELIHATDIVLHTSEWEGLARVLVQGLLAGKPVVSFDIDGAKEVVLPGETGFLADFPDIGELTRSLAALIEDSSLREQMGKTGRAKFTEPFRHETMTRRIREVYRQVLKR
ncbi:MAG TPA: glycosyltransferase family 4 protein [Planctomycetaceae bacterium]|nr:glycosyltransferase family 4 protein [Planctomycetaceae bacterium]